MTSKTTTVGWDVGGAHLKAALVDDQGSALAVLQTPCALWRGLHELHTAIDSILARLNRVPDHHVVTMTGELADFFSDRKEGVIRISGIMTERLGAATRFYAGPAGIVSGNEAASYAANIASANWLASAAFVAAKVGQGLLMDIGSTTTDIMLLSDGKPQNRGFTDSERMQFEEMVYTGVVRTPLMALGTHVPFGGEWRALAAEHFANTADVYRLTGDLIEAEDMAETADSMGKTRSESARRLARMLGHDLNDAPETAWIGLSRAFKQKQLDRLKSAVVRCLSRGLVNDSAPIIGAGAGSFLARELARQLNREYLEVETLVLGETEETRRWASVCLPAYALAALAAESAGKPV